MLGQIPPGDDSHPERWEDGIDLVFIPTDIFECGHCQRTTFSMLCGCSHPSPKKVGSVVVGYPKDPDSHIAKYTMRYS